MKLSVISRYIMEAKIGICLWSVPEKDDESRIRMARRLGIRGIEIDLGRVVEGCPLSQPETQARYKAWRTELGLTYTAMGVNELCFTAMTDPANRSQIFSVIDTAIAAAVEMEIPLLQFPSFVASDILDTAGLEASVACLRYACEQAEGAGVLIGSENALDLAGQRALLKAITHSNFRIYFDTANPKCMKGNDGPELLEVAYRHVAEVHLKDGFQDDRPALLGTGESDVAGSLAILKARGYEGWMHLENAYSKIPDILGMSAEEVIKKDIAYARSFLEA